RGLGQPLSDEDRRSGQPVQDLIRTTGRALDAAKALPGRSAGLLQSTKHAGGRAVESAKQLLPGRRRQAKVDRAMEEALTMDKAVAEQSRLREAWNGYIEAEHDENIKKSLRAARDQAVTAEAKNQRELTQAEGAARVAEVTAEIETSRRK